MVRRALDVKQAAYNNEQIDRAICAAADAVESTTQRKFYPLDATRKWDWPNFQYAYPWRVWLDNYELAAIPTLVTTGSLLPVPIVIPIAACIFQPVNEGPPFTRLELRRDFNYGFGNNSTPQLDIAITGTFGYWTRTRPAGALAAAMTNSVLTATVSDGISVGVGDVIIVDSERMIVTDANFSDTGIAYSGLSSASKADNVVTVADSTKFVIGEVIQVDAEWDLITNIVGNNLILNRAWDGSILVSHSGGTIYARRTLTVLRGQLGTTAASHASAAPVVISDVPGMIRELAVAEAIVWLAQEPIAYGGGAIPPKTGTSSKGGFNVSESLPGTGLYDLRRRVEESRFTRKARSRVI
jgi:hypothetical protein